MRPSLNSPSKLDTGPAGASPATGRATTKRRGGRRTLTPVNRQWPFTLPFPSFTMLACVVTSASGHPRSRNSNTLSFLKLWG